MKSFETKAKVKRRALPMEPGVDRGAYVSREEAPGASFAEALTRDVTESLPRRFDGRVFPAAGANRVSRERQVPRDGPGRAGPRFHDRHHDATAGPSELGLDPLEVAEITRHATPVMLKRDAHLPAKGVTTTRR